MIFKYDKSLTSKEDVKKCTEELFSYREDLKKIVKEGGYFNDESSINLPGDNENFFSVESMLKSKITDNLSLIIVAGIGGSNLGTKAVYDALYGAYDALSEKTPKIIFAETNDPEYELHIEKAIKEKVSSPENILMFIVTKSGATKETILNKDRITEILAELFTKEAVKERMIFITDKDTPLWKEAQVKGIEVLEIPKKIGGRFSVFSPVGLAPLLACGIDVKELLSGAEEMKNLCLSDSMEDNIAALSASVLFLQYKKGFTIHDSFYFEIELESLGKWYRQLLAESIGKREDKEGNAVHTGITPTISIGTQDLHSVLELNLGGPKNKLTDFINVSLKKEGEDKYKTAMQGAYKNVKDAYVKNSLPFMEIILPELSERSLGKYMQFKMMEMMYLGRLFGIDPFIQPSVEEYKREVRG